MDEKSEKQLTVEQWIAARRKARSLAKGEDDGIVVYDMFQLSSKTATVKGCTFVPTNLAYDGEACFFEGVYYPVSPGDGDLEIETPDFADPYAFDMNATAAIRFTGQNGDHIFDCETLRFTGPNDGGVFRFLLAGTPMALKLETQVLIRDRRLSEVVPEKTKELHPHVRLLDREIIVIDRGYADAMLTDDCRRLAEDVTETAYYWTVEEFGWAVVFELPALFVPWRPAVLRTGIVLSQVAAEDLLYPISDQKNDPDPTIELINDEIIKISRDVAEKILPGDCIRMAEEITETHCYWTVHGYGWIVAMSLWQFQHFNKELRNRVFWIKRTLLFQLYSFAGEYTKSQGLNNSDSVYLRLADNLARSLAPAQET